MSNFDLETTSDSDSDHSTEKLSVYILISIWIESYGMIVVGQVMRWS